MAMFINRVLNKCLLALVVVVFIPVTTLAELPSGAKEYGRPVTSPEKLTPRPEIQLPDLVVDKVYMDKTCRISFKLSNRGRGAIPDSEHELARVTIYYYQLPMRKPVEFDVYRFSDAVDPRGVLKAPGSSVTYATDIKLSQPHQVEVYVDSKHNVKESKEDNNRPEATTLNPDPKRCGSRLSPPTR
jgi:hypothetical protein